MSLERLILSGLINNDEYLKKVLPYLKEEYFHSLEEKIVYQTVDGYINKYSHRPAKEALFIELSNLDNINEQVYKDCMEVISDLGFKDVKNEWLIEQTEKFCQDKALHNAILGAIKIIDSKATERGKIPELLQEALSVSFDSYIGHEYIDFHEERWEYYHLKEHKIPFDLDYFNRITKGGVSRKTLNVALAGTGVGKSLFMCHCAAGNLLRGYNVLYLTMEMSEEEIGRRIDCNLLDIAVDELEDIPKSSFDKKMKRVKETTKGRLIIKEYPEGAFTALHMASLFNELALKSNFVPDIVYVDYLNICSSSRLKKGGVNSYEYVKAIAEEFRAFAKKMNLPIITATQTNRSGFANSDVGLENTSESFGLPATADLMFALIRTEELEQMNQIMVKQLKSRYGDKNYLNKFVVGLDRKKFRLYDLDESAQTSLIEDKPIMDKGDFETKHSDRTSKFKKGIDAFDIT